MVFKDVVKIVLSGKAHCCGDSLNVFYVHSASHLKCHLTALYLKAACVQPISPKVRNSGKHKSNLYR